VIEALFVAHLVLLGFLHRLLSEKVARIIAIFYSAYMGAFTVLKPALLYYFGLYFPYSTNKPSAVAACLVGSLIFLTIQYWGIKLMADLPPPKFAVRCFDFDEASPRGITFAFIVLMIISFIGCSIKFRDVGYLFKNLDTFAATMALSNGSFYLDIVSEILVYGFLVVMAYTYSKMPVRRSFILMIFLLGLTFVWTKLSNRTDILVSILAWTSCVMTREQQRRLNIFRLAAFGYVLLMLLYVANFIRMGAATGATFTNAAFNAVYGAAVDLSPVDNAVMLYSDLTSHDLMYFTYLAGAITPLVLIPSAIFPFKLRPDKDVALTDLFFPHGADQTFYHEGSTLTFTIPGSGYADAYYLGVVVASVLYVGLFCWYLWVYRKGTKSAKFIAAFCIMVHIAGYRLSIETMMVGFYMFISLIGLTRFLALLPSGAGGKEPRENELAPLPSGGPP
jgi:hypothetical protein